MNKEGLSVRGKDCKLESLHSARCRGRRNKHCSTRTNRRRSAEGGPIMATHTGTSLRSGSQVARAEKAIRKVCNFVRLVFSPMILLMLSNNSRVLPYGIGGRGKRTARNTYGSTSSS